MNKLKNKVINFKNLLQFIIFLIIIIIIIFLIINYYYGKSFHKCLNCEPNEVYIIDIKLPEYNIIKNLERQIRKSGSRLDPKLNFTPFNISNADFYIVLNHIKIICIFSLLFLLYSLEYIFLVFHKHP
jgi:hypothetical protein